MNKSKCINRTLNNTCVHFDSTNVYRPGKPLRSDDVVLCPFDEKDREIVLCPGFLRAKQIELRVFEEELRALMEDTIYDLNYPDVICFIAEYKRELLELLQAFQGGKHEN